jgi:hypothetical protein
MVLVNESQPIHPVQVFSSDAAKRFKYLWVIGRLTGCLHQVDPLAWMTSTLERLARGHSSQELDQLMPWRFKP